MSVQVVRRSVLGVLAGGAILAGGLFAGKLAAGPIGGHGHFSAQRMFDRIASRLDLSDSQKSQVKQVLKTHESAILAQIRAQADARRALGDAVVAEPVDEGAIRDKAATFGRVHADGAVLLAQIRAEIWPILNDEQKDKVAAFRSGMRSHGDRMASSIQSFLDSGN